MIFEVLLVGLEWMEALSSAVSKAELPEGGPPGGGPDRGTCVVDFHAVTAVVTASTCAAVIPL